MFLVSHQWWLLVSSQRPLYLFHTGRGTVKTAQRLPRLQLPPLPPVTTPSVTMSASQECTVLCSNTATASATRRSGAPLIMPPLLGIKGSI